jgi:Flp pilus assembly pilin Flp
MKSKRRGQSILEYTLLIGAVIAVIVAVLLGSGGIREKIQGGYEAAGGALERTTDDLSTGIFQ